MLRFRPSSGRTIGIEMEYQLIDPVTMDLADGIISLMKSCTDEDFMKPEFTQASIEINSGIAGNIGDLEKAVYAEVATLKQKCRDLGMDISGSGTHPFSTSLAKITPTPRYVKMERRGGLLCHLLKTYAFHVHVGMASGEETIAVMNGIRPYLPLLMALAANSPFWWGHDTGYACYRQKVLASYRSYGLPPNFVNWEDFSNFYQAAQRARCYHDYIDIHWDIRPRPDMGTIEVRIMDVQPTVRETLILSAFVHALIEFICERWKKSTTEGLLVPGPYWVERENYHRAARHGTDAILIINEKGRTRSLKEIAHDVVSGLAETAAGFGAGSMMELLASNIDGEVGYQRQSRVFNDGGTLKDVVKLLVTELDEDLAGFRIKTSSQ